MSVPLSLRREIYVLDNKQCAYCHTPEELIAVIYEIEHIHPKSNEGKTVLENLCLSCPTCNRHKSTYQQFTDPQTGQIVPLFHPRQQKWLDHFCWNEARTELIGLTAVGRATLQVLRINRPQLVNLRKLWGKMGYRLE